MKQNLLRHIFVLVLAIIASTGLSWAGGYDPSIDIIPAEKETVYVYNTQTIHDTVYVEKIVEKVVEEKSNQEGGWGFLLSILASVIAAGGALILTYLLLRPKFEIYPIAAQDLNNRLWFIVKNTSHFAKLYSIKVELSYIDFDDVRNDTAITAIELPQDRELSVMETANSGNDSFYAFHTEEAFIRDNQHDQIRLRVSSTNTISNIFDAKERVFTYATVNTYDAKDDVRWGKFDGNIFVGVDAMYKDDELEKAKVLIQFNEKVAKIFSPYQYKEDVIQDKAIWAAAKDSLQQIKKGGDLYKMFDDLKVIEPTINKINKDFEKLYKLYTMNTYLTHANKDKKDILIKEMNREFTRISQFMKNSISKK